MCVGVCVHCTCVCESVCALYVSVCVSVCVHCTIRVCVHCTCMCVHAFICTIMSADQQIQNEYIHIADFRIYSNVSRSL